MCLSTHSRHVLSYRILIQTITLDLREIANKNELYKPKTLTFKLVDIIYPLLFEHSVHGGILLLIVFPFHVISYTPSRPYTILNIYYYIKYF